MNHLKYIIAIAGSCILANNARSQSPTPAAGMLTLSLSAASPAWNKEVNGIQGAYYEPAHIISFDMYEDKKMIFCNFKTQFDCHSYAIEGKQGPYDEYKSLYYCHDHMCVNTRDRVSISFSNTDVPCRYFRIKTVLDNGEIHYSQTRSVDVSVPNEIEILDPLVGKQLGFRFNTGTNVPAFSYTIAGINGSILHEADGITKEAIDLEVLPAGFYFISFNSISGRNYHYKFFKTVSL